MKTQAQETATYIDILKTKLSLQEFSAKKATVASPSHSQPVIDPEQAKQIQSLQTQLSTCMDELESLTLDKEQAMLENEEMEENLFKCQVELEATKKALRGPDSVDSDASSSNMSDTERCQLLQIENDKIREGLRRLHDISVKDKEDLRESLIAAEESRRQCIELDQWKTDAEFIISELRETVDASSSFEAMIEKLTDQNLELSSTMVR